jgi:enoyl-CoA hydratase/carnithine racemase
MELKFSKVERKGPVTLVTLSRPEVYNALHIDAHFELNKVFDDFCADPAQWVAIVTGAGDRAFCAGNDLKWQAAGGKRGWDTGGFAGLTSRFDCDKPIIAAVNGVAMGGGFEIALACDLIIAAENATFALPEPRVGLAALAGGLQRLPRQIGLKRAMGMILTARHVSAKEGFELGFVNEVVPVGEALAAAERWAETICRNSPMSIRASKQAIQKGLAVSLEQAITEQRDYPAVKAMAASQDYVEGPKAFAEKRPPQWLGRYPTVVPGHRGAMNPEPRGSGFARFTRAPERQEETDPSHLSSPTLSCTTHSSAGRLRACRAWSATDARGDQGSRDRPCRPRCGRRAPG